jgi:hypothetical protein
MREQGGDRWQVCLFGSDAPSVIEEVASGEVQVAAINPSMMLNLAVKGTGPFKNPIPLRAVAVIPSSDQLGFAVAGATGLTSLSEIRERRFPLRLSLRGQPDHSLHLVVKETLSQVDVSLGEVRAWGGKVFYDEGRPGDPHGFRARVDAVRRGDCDAIFDEALNLWTNLAVEAGMRFLSLEESHLQRLEALGLRRGIIRRSEFSKLDQDVTSLDFSGWAVYTHVSVPDAVIRSFCAALEDSKDSILWQEKGPLPLERMCRDTPEAPLGIPLHPAAERFWRERGYLS